MTQRFSNNARSRLVGALSNSATSFTVESATADLFPVGNTPDWLTTNDWFKAAIENSLGQVEIVHVGVRGLGSGVFSNVLRGQDGTTAIAFDAGAVVGLRITAQDVEEALAIRELNNTFSGDNTHTGENDFTGVIKQGGVEARTVPVGGIIMYDGLVADIPAGWQLCDGTNGTPDLRDKFVIGARQDDAGAAKTNVTGALTESGGSKDAVVVTHSHDASAGDQSADHTHSGTTGTDGAHTHELVKTSGDAVGGGTTRLSRATMTGGQAESTQSAGEHSHEITTGGVSASHNHEITVDEAGESGTNKNLPPYYALAFIRCMEYA